MYITFLIMSFHHFVAVVIEVYKKFGRLHRDVSLANIIMVREPGRSVRMGYLVDWDASCRTDESGNAVVVGPAVSSHIWCFLPLGLTCRAWQGTWLFMSMAMLSYPGKDRKQTFQDDMESLLYVVLYCALLWLPHEHEEGDLEHAIKMMFE